MPNVNPDDLARVSKLIRSKVAMATVYDDIVAQLVGGIRTPSPGRICPECEEIIPSGHGHLIADGVRLCDNCAPRHYHEVKELVPIGDPDDWIRNFVEFAKRQPHYQENN